MQLLSYKRINIAMATKTLMMMRREYDEGGKA